MDDPEDDYETALPFSFAEDPCVADIPHSVAAASLDLLPDGPHQALHLHTRPTGHMDGGSMVSTTNQQHHLWHFRPLADHQVARCQ
jgi:hypothetical protein